MILDLAVAEFYWKSEMPACAVSRPRDVRDVP